MKILIFILIFCSSNVIRSQVNFSQKEKIKYKLSKNIKMFKIKKSDLNPKICYDDTDFFLNRVIPDKPYELFLKFEEINLNFPNSSFVIYRVNNPRGKWFNPIDGNYLVNSENIENDPDYLFLIAVHKETREVLYISGSFYKSSISHFYKNISTENPLSFIDFLKIKLYNLNVKNIKFLKRTKKQLIFSANADFFDLTKEICISVDTDNFDNILITGYPREYY